jgi:signal peptidase II
MSRWGRAAGVLVAVLVVDQVTKALVRGGVTVGDEDPVLPFLSIVHVRNNGVAFGFFSNAGALLVVLTGVALVALLVFFARSPHRPGLWLPTGLLLGGALGNLLDRARAGEVTDFLKLTFWPAFNVADIAITVGVLALIYVLEGPKQKQPATSS